MSPEEAVGWMDENAIEQIDLYGVNHDSIPVGKRLRRSKFQYALPAGPTVSDLVFGWDVTGELYLQWWDRWRSAGWIGEVVMVPDLSTLTTTTSPGVARCVADFSCVDGSELDCDPRTILKRQVRDLESIGYRAQAAFEIEFMVFENSMSQARSLGYRNLQPMSTPVPVCYLAENLSHQADFMNEVVAELDVMGIPWECWSSEAAPGQIELNMTPLDPVSAADAVIGARSCIRSVARRRGLAATFMSKPLPDYGNGTHLHHSLVDLAGLPVFYDDLDEMGMSPVMKNWVAGVMSVLEGSVCLAIPTVDGFSRLEPFSGVPTHAIWAGDDKSVAVRVLSAGSRSSRVEYRIPGGEVNPYLALAAVLAGGISGVTEGAELEAPHRGLGYFLPAEHPMLPGDIWEAAEALDRDERLRSRLGDDFVDFWVYSRKFEWLAAHEAELSMDSAQLATRALVRNFELP